MIRATSTQILWAGIILTTLGVLASFLFYAGNFSDDRLNPMGGLSVGDITRFAVSVLSPIQQVAAVLGPVLIGTSFVVAAIDRQNRSKQHMPAPSDSTAGLP